MSEVMDIFTPEGDIFGMNWSAGNKKMEKAQKSTKANEALAPILEQKRVEEAARVEEERTQESKRRAALFATPTSGFGPNTNLARSFLTTL